MSSLNRLPIIRRMLSLGIILCAQNFSQTAHSESMESTPHPLMVVAEEASCRIRAEPHASTSQKQWNGPREKLRIYLKRNGTLIEEPYAELTPDNDIPNVFPYLVTGGSILSTPVGCRNLVGKIAIAQSQDPIWKSKMNAEKALGATPQPPVQTPPPQLEDQQNIDSPQIQPTQNDLEPPLAETSEPGKNLSDNPSQSLSDPLAPAKSGAELAIRREIFKPRLSLELGFTFAYGSYAGMYIDTNTDIDLSMAGPRAGLSFFPQRLWSASGSQGAFSPLEVWSEFEILESTRNLRIMREGQSIGIQETTLNRIGAGFNYSWRYLSDRHESKIILTAWERSDLRNSTRFDPSSGGRGSSLRDLQVDCSALGFSQSYHTQSGHVVGVQAETCLRTSSKTPAIGDADIPNSTDAFSNSQSIRIKLLTEWSLLTESDFKLGTSIDLNRWVGELTLNDDQIIDSSATVIRASVSLKNTL